MYKKTFLALASVFIILCCSCSKRACIDPLLVIQFQGFDSVDLTSIRLQVLERGTSTIKSDNIFNYYTGPGGRGVYISYKKYDYTFTITSLSKEYKLSDFSVKQRKLSEFNPMGGEAETCSNNVFFKENGNEKSSGAQDECSMDNHCTAYFPIYKE